MDKVLRLLVVEDYEGDYELIVHLLGKAGYKVHGLRVETAREMQEALERQTWDVVIADYRLPQFDAPTALRILQQSGLDLPFIVVSGIVGEETAVAMMRAGAHDYLMKDNLVRLAPAVEREKQEAQVRRERRQAQAALQARNRTLAQLNQAGRAFSATLDLDQVLAAIMAETHRLLEVMAASLWLVDPDGQALTCHTATGPGADRLMGRRIPYGAGIIGRVAQQDAGLIVANVQTDARPGQATGESQDPSLRALLSVPLRAREKVIGVLQVLDTRADRFTADDQQTLELLAASAAIALENARLYQQAQGEIAERKRAEEALAESERRYRGLFEGVPIGLYRTAADGRILAANPALAEMLGYASPEELLGLNVVDFYTNPAKRAEQQIQLARADIVSQDEIELRRRDGRFLWALDTFRAVRDHDGRLLWNEGSLQDVTERKQAEESLRQKSRNLATLLKISQALATTLTLETVLRLIVERATEVADLDSGAIYLFRGEELYLGATMPPLPPQFPEEFRRAPLADHPHVWQAVAGSTPVIIADTAATDLTPAEQAICEVHGLRSLLFLPLMIEKRPVGVLIVGTIGRTRTFSDSELDMYRTLAGQAVLAIENARLYDQIRSHAAELEQRVAERTAELRAANERLQELDRLKSEFVSNVSHELRTPLANIKTYLWLLEKGRPEKHGEYMATLHRETDLLQHQIESLLHLSRLDLNKVRPVLAPVDVNRMVGLLVADRTVLFSDRGLALRFEPQPDLPPALGDEKMLIQVLTNLMTNAMNYTPAGGVVTVSTAARISDFGFRISDSAGDSPQSAIRNPQWVTFSVSDTGPGIAPDEQARLFERFYRGEVARRSGAQGTGLGLAICHEIVQRHGGRITVESEVGKGSTFTVWLPAIPNT